MTLPQHIASKLDRTSPHGCWLWTGSLDRDGYGRVGKHGIAHRVVYELTKGPIPAGHVLMHSCDHLHQGIEGRRCCAPEHLTPGTVAQNAQDRGRKGRGYRQSPRAPGCPPGRRYW